MKRISKRVREQAAMYLAVIASNVSAYAEDTVHDVLEAVGASRHAERVAHEALDFAVNAQGGYGRNLSRAEQMLDYAEAESLLRTGWEPTHAR